MIVTTPVFLAVSSELSTNFLGTGLKLLLMGVNKPKQNKGLAPSTSCFCQYCPHSAVHILVQAGAHQTLGKKTDLKTFSLITEISPLPRELFSRSLHCSLDKLMSKELCTTFTLLSSRTAEHRNKSPSIPMLL